MHTKFQRRRKSHLHRIWTAIVWKHTATLHNTSGSWLCSHTPTNSYSSVVLTSNNWILQIVATNFSSVFRISNRTLYLVNKRMSLSTIRIVQLKIIKIFWHHQRMPEELATINYMNRVVQLEKPVCISLVHSINYTYFFKCTSLYEVFAWTYTPFQTGKKKIALLN